MPGIGSPVVGETCDIPRLRSSPVKGFPVHWYYFVGEDHLDVVRLLADAQDLPAIGHPSPPTASCSSVCEHQVGVRLAPRRRQADGTGAMS